MIYPTHSTLKHRGFSPVKAVHEKRRAFASMQAGNGPAHARPGPLFQTRLRAV